MDLWLIVRGWEGRVSYLRSINLSENPCPTILAGGIAGAARYFLLLAERDPLERPSAAMREVAGRWTTRGL